MKVHELIKVLKSVDGEIVVSPSIEIYALRLATRICANCGKGFVPSNRSNEIYCNNVFKGSRTCKQAGYEQKVSNDNSMKFIKAYRTAYKTKNAQKQRSEKGSVQAAYDFNKWVYAAKAKLEDAQAGDITLDEFKEWLKGAT